MPTEDEVFFDQATRPRGQAEGFFDQATRSRGQVALKQPREKWLEMDGFTAFQLKIIAGFLTPAKPREQEYMAQLCTREDVFIKERSTSREEIALCRPASLPRVLLANFPVVSGDQMINSAVDGFKKIGEILDLALAKAGCSLDTTYTEYESIFGVKIRGSELLFAERSRMVKENIKKMKVKLSEEWVLVNYPTFDSVASVSNPKVNRIDLGKLFFTRTPLEGALILIHEIGHLVGLHDICTQCHNIDIVRFPTADPGPCRENSAHGKLADVDPFWGGHVITYARALILADKNPDLAVWNTDSYRRYGMALCSADLSVPAPAKKWKHHERKSFRYL